MTRQLQQGNQTLIRDNVVHVSPDVGNFDHDGQAGDDHRDTLFTFDAQDRQLTRTLPLDVSSFKPNAIGVGVLDASGHIPTTFTPDPFTEYFWHNNLGQRVYAYDAYGLPIGFDPANALTNLLYSGEQFDQRIAMQYLRARYCNPATGTFNRLDPFAGNTQDPQSLHKYLYVHGDPVNGIDPTGEAVGATHSMVTIGILALLNAITFEAIHKVGPKFAMQRQGLHTIKVPVDVAIVKPVHIQPGNYFPWLQGDVASDMSKVIEFWERHGIVIDYSIRTVVKDDWKLVEGTDFGTGEVQDVIDQLYRGKPVLAFVPQTSQNAIGITEWEGRGAVVSGGASWAVAAHELGHIFGLTHGHGSHLGLSTCRGFAGVRLGIRDSRAIKGVRTLCWVSKRCAMGSPLAHARISRAGEGQVGAMPATARQRAAQPRGKREPTQKR